jgi:hypothetical protein
MRGLDLSKAAALSALIFMALLAPGNAARAEEFLQVRINRMGGDMHLIFARGAVKSLAQMSSGATVSLGSFQGKDVRLSLDRFVRALDEAPSSTKEALLMTRQSDLGPIRFYVRSIFKEIQPRRPSPSLLAVDLKKKGGGEDTHLVLPMAGAALVAETLTKLLGLQVDSDVSPFVANCLKCAKDLGSGPLMRVSGSDAEIVLSTD